MKWLFRPSVVIAVSAALVAAAALAVRRRPEPPLPVPLAVDDADTEVVWLYPATNTAAWDRFVDAVRSTRGPGVEVHDDKVLPPESTGVPEVAVSWPGSGGRLVFRWYKLTSRWRTQEWVQALLARPRKPLAIIGGSNSNLARELAVQLRDACDQVPKEDRPLLLLTTATADRVRGPEGPGGQPEAPPDRPPATPEEEWQAGRPLLHTLYPGRTFRFSFTNRQMATAITRFIWGHDDLRPDADPVYTVQWNDDEYSQDLLLGYWRVLRARVLDTWAEQWAWAAGGLGRPGLAGGFVPALAGGPFPRNVGGRSGTGLQLDTGVPLTLRIDSSVGVFGSPNPYEAEQARVLLDQFYRGVEAPADEGRPPDGPAGHARQRRPLLVVTGQSSASRRFLRELARSSPDAARRFVVATGDAISFNTIYRDGAVTWPVQDLPFKLVLFCHQNPVDDNAGFEERGAAPGRDEGSAGPPRGPSGTEDLLMFREIVQVLTRALGGEGGAGVGARGTGPEGLRERLNATELFRLDDDGDEARHGMRRGGTGEHVVCLRPTVQHDPGDPQAVLRVRPEASLEVWAWRTRNGGSGARRTWERVKELRVVYDEPREAGGGHGAD